MKKLPKIYQNNFNKRINNNKEVCYLKNESIDRNNGKEIDITLSEIFSGIGYSYNIPVIINTYSKVYETSLIAKTKNNVITIDNDVIPLNEIISIKRM